MWTPKETPSNEKVSLSEAHFQQNIFELGYTSAKDKTSHLIEAWQADSYGTQQIMGQSVQLGSDLATKLMSEAIK